jgi:beta-glucanase (GH16 family)
MTVYRAGDMLRGIMKNIWLKFLDSPGRKAGDRSADGATFVLRSPAFRPALLKIIRFNASCMSVVLFICSTLFTGFALADEPRSKVEPGAPKDLAADSFLAVPGKDYKLVWNDEFNGSHLDTTRWTSGLPWKGSEDGHWHNDQYASYITDDDVSVSGGSLHLTCRRQEIHGKKQDFHFTEGFVHTSGKYQFTYGYAEARCKSPMDAGPGMWPAFWTLSTGWPPEFDIIEVWTAEPRIHQGYAYANPNGRGEIWKSYHKKGVTLNGYHTFGMEWGPGYIFFNIDGVVNNRVFGDCVTSKPEYLILNSGIGSGKGNVPPSDKTVFPNSFDVDYCRVYQRAQVTPIVQNSGFEFDDPAPWSVSKLVSVANIKGRSHSGEKSLRVSAGGISEQKIYGLKPNTTYHLSGWMMADAKAIGRFGVKGLASAADARSQAFDNSHMEYANPEEGTLQFTTGKNDVTAVVYCQNVGDTGAVYFDDLELKP